MTESFLQKIQGVVQRKKAKQIVEANINILVCGGRQTGKTLFIHKFLNYPPNHSSSLEKGTSNSNADYTPVKYERKEEMPGIVMWEDARHHQKEGGLLELYDVVVLLSRDKLPEELSGIAERFNAKKVPCFSVLTHFDKRLEVEVQPVGDKDKNHATLTCGNPVDIYFINTTKPDQHDFPRLQRDIKAALPKEKRSLADKRLFLLSDEDVRVKADAWRKDVPLTSIPGGVSGLSPIPGTDIVAELGIIAYQAVKLYRDFGLSQARLLELCETYGLPPSAAQQVRQQFQYARMDVDTIENVMTDRERVLALIGNYVKWGFIGIAFSGGADVAKTVPVIGTAIGCAIGGVSGYLTTLYILKAIIDGCEQDGLVTVRELRRLLADNPQKPSSQ